MKATPGTAIMTRGRGDDPISATLAICMPIVSLEMSMRSLIRLERFNATNSIVDRPAVRPWTTGEEFFPREMSANGHYRMSASSPDDTK